VSTGSAFVTEEDAGLRIAMWSGPRNVSTAMMRAWENRGDTAVVDEPFYAYYLSATGLEHPMREQVIAAGDTDWRDVVDRLTGPVPGGKRIYYQKQMTHHMLPAIDRGWLGDVCNCFLIRHPRDVLLSYVRQRTLEAPEDLGFVQQARIFEQVSGGAATTPVVIDAADLLADPRTMLSAVCRRLGIGFTERMLAWPAGPRDSDGVWGPHWYESVYASTGFAPVKPRNGSVPREFHAILDACLPHYEQLHAHRITAGPGHTAHPPRR